MFTILTQEIEQNITTYTHEGCRTVEIVRNKNDNIQLIAVESGHEGVCSVEFVQENDGNAKHLIWLNETTLIMVNSHRDSRLCSLFTCANHIVFETWNIPLDGSNASAELINKSNVFSTKKCYLTELESVDFEGPVLKARFSDDSIQLWKWDAEHSAMKLIDNPEPFAAMSCIIL